MFLDKYKIDEEILEYSDSYDILENLGRKRGCLISGGNVDTEKASKIFLDELKAGKIGRISLESI
jgi:ribosome biogenesis GTPase A